MMAMSSAAEHASPHAAPLAHRGRRLLRHLPYLAGAGVACALTAGVTWLLMGGRMQQAYDEVQTLQRQVQQTHAELLGYSRYSTYLTVGKQSLAEHLKLLTATVVREEGVTQVVERSVLGFSSTGTVAIWYTVEYPVGYDLQPGSYDIRSTPAGIEIRLHKPALVAQPAVRDLRYKILSGGLFTDEKAAVLKLYEQASAQAAATGKTIASDPAVMALCEKKLIEFLADFLRKQPGVTMVPQIRVVYTS